jgi:uncharacterized protein YciI
MENKILNDQVFNVFIVIAETLEKWQNPSSEEGKNVLMEHYKWGAELKSKNKLILAGPTNFELTSANKINPIGHTTGIIMLNATTREEATKLAEKDPFHLHGYRRNIVLSLKISMTEKSVFETLQKIINQP